MVSNGITGVVGLTIGALVVLGLYPEKPFLTVHEMHYADGRVFVKRSIDLTDGQPVIADWRVTVVGGGSSHPTCQTKASLDIDAGWSVYNWSEPTAQDFHLDAWVGDAGCYNRLPSGENQMWITWTPRDGRDPVVEYLRFEK